MPFIPEALVEDDSHEYVCLHDLTSLAVVERFGAVVVVATGPQLLAHVVDGFLLFVEAEGRGVLECAVY